MIHDLQVLLDHLNIPKEPKGMKQSRKSMRRSLAPKNTNSTFDLIQRLEMGV
jgi:hypothetical protein